MPEQINYAESYQGAIQDKFYGGLYSAELYNSPSNKLVKFLGQKIVNLPVLNINGGRKDRTRRSITEPKENYTNNWIPKSLDNERYWSTLVDPSDVDETNYVTSIANITEQFNKQEKMPEMDKYMFSKLHSELKVEKADNIKESELTASNILSVFDEMMLAMDEAQVPAVGRVLYVGNPVKTILKNAEQLQRQIDVTSNNGKIDRAVHSLDDVTIKPVPSSLFKTMYDFTEGAKDVKGAQQIQMMLILPEVMAAPEKYTFAGLDNPSAANSGNYLYYEQSYGDVFLMPLRQDGIRMVVAPKAVEGGE